MRKHTFICTLLAVCTLTFTAFSANAKETIEVYNKYSIITKLLDGEKAVAVQNLSSEPKFCYVLSTQKDQKILSQNIAPHTTSDWAILGTHTYSEDTHGCLPLRVAIQKDTYTFYITQRRNAPAKVVGIAIYNKANVPQICSIFVDEKRFIANEIVKPGAITQFKELTDPSEALCVPTESQHTGHSVLIKIADSKALVAFKNTGDQPVKCTIHSDSTTFYESETIAPGKISSWANYSLYIQTNHKCI